MIKARIPAADPAANLKNYDQTYRDFDWQELEAEFDWPEPGRVNIVHQAVDRWAADAEAADRPALIFDSAARSATYTYQKLHALSCQWANFFSQHGYRPGDRLFIFLPPCPETFFALLASVRLGVIFSPLFAGLSYDDLEFRLKNARPKGVLTTPDLAERLPDECLDELEHVFLLDGPAPNLSRKEIVVGDAPAGLPAEREPVWLEPETPLYLLYTSGSTGPPKGIIHAHRDMVGHLATARWVLDLEPGTVLWTDADPSWVTGAVYSSFGPWLIGATSVVQGDPFSASSWYLTLEKHKVSTWYTTPRTIRGLMAAGTDLPKRYDLSHLKHVATVGASLSPELYYWVKTNLGRIPHDTWWMTETGMICLANFPSLDTKPGSMGKPAPGVEAAVIDDDGRPLPVMALGQLALRPTWPAMMVGVWRDEPRYQEYFRLEGWFLTGDVAVKDEDGYFFHQGRSDDLIKVGDTFVGPYEIERVIGQHPAVAEAAVIALHQGEGQPKVKAFVTVDKTVTPSTRLGLEIKAFVRANLSAEVPLTEVAFLDELPKTGTGKILRRVLRAMELGLPSGDVTKLKD